MPSWHLITGEYPPQPGGVSDYTRLIAGALAKAGDEVHIWAPRCEGLTDATPGILVHRLPGHFGFRALAALDAGLRYCPGRVFVQYVPHAFGWRAMNLLFCLWLRARQHRRVWVMFHEVASPVHPSLSWKHNLLGRVHLRMAALVLSAAERCFVSIPHWEVMLRSLVRDGPPIIWLPVPSNLPTQTRPEEVAAVRARVASRPGTTIVGHFGTFGATLLPLLKKSLPRLLAADPSRVALLIGRGGDRFAQELAREHPELRDRLFAPGALSEQDLTAHLAVCDVLLQPYPEGVSTRRTSLMAGLALGVPTVTTEGVVTEPLWRASEAMMLAPAADPDALVRAAEAVLSDPGLRDRLRKAALALYQDHFTVDRVVKTLRGVDAPVGMP